MNASVAGRFHRRQALAGDGGVEHRRTEDLGGIDTDGTAIEGGLIQACRQKVGHKQPCGGITADRGGAIAVAEGNGLDVVALDAGGIGAGRTEQSAGICLDQFGAGCDHRIGLAVEAEGRTKQRLRRLAI